MKQLFSGDDRVVRIIQKKKIHANRNYRLSAFVFIHEVEGQVLLKNTLTRQVYSLSQEEWESVQNVELTRSHVEELAKLRFLVEESGNETNQYLTIVDVLRTIKKEKAGIRSYTILPTTACNARCFYCYEEKWKSFTMESDTVDTLVDFICRTKQEGSIVLDWFGGEPLCEAKTISRICRALQKRGVDYISTIITNGTLLTPELVKEAVNLWNIKKAQISMDGAREDYEKRKSYLRPDLHNYDKAMDGVILLANAGVKVNIRCNYDEENLPRIKAFLADCKERFGERKSISIYLEKLYQIAGEKDETDIYIAAGETVRQIRELGLTYTKRIPTLLSTHYCMADGRASVVIDPKGKIHFCEHLSPGDNFGSIFDNGPFLFPTISSSVAEECKGCTFLPECTPFRKKGCRIMNTGCRIQKEMETAYEMEALLHDTHIEDEAADQAC